MQHPAQQIQIPFALAEQPRLLLGWLALNSTLPEAARAKIAEWVLHYNERMQTYVEGKYGHMALHAADHFSRILAASFNEQIMADYNQANADMFDNLERDIFGEDGV